MVPLFLPLAFRLALTGGVTYAIYYYRQFTIPIFGWIAFVFLTIAWINLAFRLQKPFINLESLDWVEPIEDSICGDPDCRICKLLNELDD